MAHLSAQKAPNLPIAPAEYDQRYMDQFNNVLRLYFNAGDNAMGSLLNLNGGDFLRFSFGGFSDTTTQTAAVINTAYPITFDTLGPSNEITRGTITSRISPAHPGIYNIQLSGNVHTTAGTGNLFFWLRVNGINIAATGGKVGATTGDTIVTRNYLYEFAAGDFFELVWSASATTVEFLATAASAPVPAIPSVILSVTRVAESH